MDPEQKQQIVCFATHLVRLAADIRNSERSGLSATADDLQASGELILELSNAIDLEGMQFTLETKLP